MPQHTALFWFLDDLFHQFLFYFGGIVGTLIFVIEKWKKKPVQWRWVGAFLLFCLFVACFQVFVDEHRNSQRLIEDKTRLSSENGQMQSKLDAKQNEVDYLRDHQHIQITETAGVDPRIGNILARLDKEEESLRSEPAKNLKRGLVDVAKNMLSAFQAEQMKTNAAQQRIENERISTYYPPHPTPDQQIAIRAQEVAQWQKDNQETVDAWNQMEYSLRAQMMAQYGPQAIALLEQLQTLGKDQTGLSPSDLDSAIRTCTFTGAGSAYWQTQECAERLSVIAQKMH